MFAFNAIDSSHSQDSFRGLWTRSPIRRNAQRRATIRSTAAGAHKSRRHSANDIADKTTGPGAARAALRAQVEHEHKLKQESKLTLTLTLTLTPTLTLTLTRNAAPTNATSMLKNATRAPRTNRPPTASRRAQRS
eukprot:6178941-Pleurochrysis_carterae.AAC.1